MLWLHSVVNTDGPNIVIHLTALPPEVPEIVGSPLRLGASSSSLTSSVESGGDSSARIHKPTRWQQAVPKQTFHLQVSLAAIGISFVDSRPREVRES